MSRLTQWGVVIALGTSLMSCDDAHEISAAAATSVKGAGAERPSPRAVLGPVKGEVSVKRAAGDTWVAAGESMELFENDKLRTAPGASAQLRFSNGSTLSLGEDALIGIAESRPGPAMDRSDVTVLKGRIDAELSDPTSQSLVVTTPAATVRAGREIVFQ